MWNPEDEEYQKFLEELMQNDGKQVLDEILLETESEETEIPTVLSRNVIISVLPWDETYIYPSLRQNFIQYFLQFEINDILAEISFMDLRHLKTIAMILNSEEKNLKTQEQMLMSIYTSLLNENRKITSHLKNQISALIYSPNNARGIDFKTNVKNDRYTSSGLEMNTKLNEFLSQAMKITRTKNGLYNFLLGFKQTELVFILKMIQLQNEVKLLKLQPKQNLASMITNLYYV